MDDDDDFECATGDAVPRVPLEEIDNLPLFATKLPEGELPPAFEALQMMAYEGTPDEIATNFRTQGNEAFRRGKQWWDDAIVFYNKALEAKAPDAALNASVYLNRAAVEMAKGNNGRALADCKQSIKLAPAGSLKAFWRAAKAALAISKLEEAVEFCAAGIKIEPENAEMLKLKKMIDDAVEAERRHEEERARREREAAEDAAARAELSRRGIRLGEPSLNPTDLSAMLGSAHAIVDADGKLVLPVALAFPESGMVDAVAAWHEESTFGEEIREVLKDRRPWDDRGEYVNGKNVDVYVSLGGRRGADPGARLAKLKDTSRLADLLKHKDYVMPNTLVPELFVISRASPYRKQFLQSAD